MLIGARTLICLSSGAHIALPVAGIKDQCWSHHLFVAGNVAAMTLNYECRWIILQDSASWEVGHISKFAC